MRLHNDPCATYVRRSTVALSALAVNIVLKLANREFLIADDALDEIADRNDADQFFSVDHGQMADALVCHDGHTFLDGLFRLHHDYLFFHYVALGYPFNRSCA